VADITENIGLHIDLTGDEANYQDLMTENFLKLDAYAPLSVLEQIDLASLPVSPSDGDKYIVDDQDIYIRQSGQWAVHPLVAGQIFHDQNIASWFKYDGTAVTAL